MANLNMRALALLSCLIAILTPISVSAEETAWNYRGSLMKLVHTGNEVLVKYLHPKEALRKDGVQRGTILFQGTLQDDKTLKGSLFAFREGCDPLSYDATGRFDPRSLLENFEIEGTGPQWTDKGCETKPADGTAAVSKLTFTPYGAEEEPLTDEPDAAAAAAVGDQSRVELTVASPAGFPRAGVSQGGAVRDGPAMKGALLDTLNQGDEITLVEDTGQSMNGYNWYKIKYQGGKGYHWGGLICVQGEALTGVLNTCR